MIENLLTLNYEFKNPDQFIETDPDLSKLKRYLLVNKSPLLEKFPTSTPGIYTLTGGGLVGKTTLLKQWIEILLFKKNISANQIYYYSANSISNYHELITLIQTTLQTKNKYAINYIFLDDITYIKDWEKSIKFLIDLGLLEHTILFLVSSDKLLRNKLIELNIFNDIQNNNNHFHLYPLSFHETILLKHPHEEINFYDEFNQYLLHGGYLIAINNMASHHKILESTLKMYTDWMRKEIINCGRQEIFSHDILTAIINNYNKPITWNFLTKELSINHPKTIGDYITLLESLDVLFVQFALTEKTLGKAPKKARKTIFTDPFIFHSIKSWINPINDPFETQILPILKNSSWCTKLVMTTTTMHFSRFYPTYYIKDEGDIDLAYIFDNRFWPILITWTNELNTKDLKQLLKYPNGKILTKSQKLSTIDHIRTEPLPLALWKIYD